MSEVAGGVAEASPSARLREQRAWYWYDWANSAYTTTIGTVFFGPYFINLAENAVGEGGQFDIGMFSLPPGALFFWLIISRAASSTSECSASPRAPCSSG